MSVTGSTMTDKSENKAFYSGDPSNRQPDRWKSLPYSLIDELNDPEGYRPDKGLVDAVNVALMLGQPLLLTGEPGTGKTQLAYSIAHELGFDAPLKFETKSTTEGKDLFYTFDTLARFHSASQDKSSTEAINPVNYISYNALGLAILNANAKDKVGDILPPSHEHPQEPIRSIVLIDEVDKAPREVPNDILNEIESMYFRIPELGHRVVSADAQWRPVVIVTSNSEKALPDAFLRRCVYYHIPFPEREQLEEILALRIGRQIGGSNKLLGEMMDFFEWLRLPQQRLRKKPGTAEMLSWALVLGKKDIEENASLKTQGNLIAETCQALFKNQEDLSKASNLIEKWANS